MNIKTPTHWKLNADSNYDVKENVYSSDLKPFVKEGNSTISFDVVNGDLHW